MLWAEMVVAVVAIVMVARLLRDRQRQEFARSAEFGAEAADALTAEVARLRQRVAVLERIATDRGHLLADEIEQLRSVDDASVR